MDPENTNAEWVKVKEWFSRVELKRISTLDDDEDEGDKEKQLLDNMESAEVLNGSPTQTKTCPFVWFNFLLASGRNVPSKDAPVAAGQVPMFSTYDPRCFYPVSQRVVSKALLDLKLVGIEPCTSFLHPNPIPIEDAMSKKRGEHYVKWRPEEDSIPMALAESLWASSRGELEGLAGRLNNNRGNPRQPGAVKSVTER